MQQFSQCFKENVSLPFAVSFRCAESNGEVCAHVILHADLNPAFQDLTMFSEASVANSVLFLWPVFKRESL